jgi:hypothetical protein
MVDLPAPDGPTTASVPPGGTENETSRRIGRSGRNRNRRVERDRAAGDPSAGAPGLSAISGLRSSRANMSRMSTRLWRISR